MCVCGGVQLEGERQGKEQGSWEKQKEVAEAQAEIEASWKCTHAFTNVYNTCLHMSFPPPSLCVCDGV